MRFFYSLLLWILLPWLVMRLFWRALGSPGYRHRVNERFGFGYKPLSRSIWIHAVSVGETMAAKPLIEALMKQYPNDTLVVTTMTVTGAETVKRLFGDRVIHYYLPYDYRYAMRRLIHAIQPKQCIIMETEWWPNMLSVCHAQSIPVYLLNARLSEKSFQRYQYIHAFASQLLNQIKKIAAISTQDRDRLIALGADPNRVSVTGHVKYDMTLPADLNEKVKLIRDEIGKERYCWIAASTHEGEDQLILSAHQTIRMKYTNALLILVPRHPERFASVAALVHKQFNCVRRSEKTNIASDTAVYLGDTMGDLIYLYGVSDVAFVGGSLVETGGHNLLEPAALAKPVVSGTHLFNFMSVRDALLENDALRLVANEQALAEVVIQFFADEASRKAAGERAFAVMAKNRGALKKQLEMVCESC